jgi:hypothetical protein
MTRPFRLGLAVSALAAVTVGLAPAAAHASTETTDRGRGAGFSTSWVEHGTTTKGRAAGLRGNTHVGFLQTFQNVGKPLFVDGTIQDFRCGAGQDPTQDECRSLGVHTLTAAKGLATVRIGRELAWGKLVGYVRIAHEDGTGRRVQVDLRLHEAGALRPHHYLDEYVDEDFTRRYEETGKERAALARGSVAGSTVRKAESTMLRFRWTDVKTTP